MPKSEKRRHKHLVLFVDGASRGNPGPAGIGVLIKDAKGRVIKEIEEFIGTFTNNVAEYRALIRGLDEAKTLGADAVDVRSDSDLLVSQLDGSYKVKSPDLSPLYLEANRLLRAFLHHTVQRIPRGQNAAADALANRAIDKAVPESAVEFSVLVERRGEMYVARVPALADVEARGTTRSEALERVRDAIVERVKDLRAKGKPIPKEERIRVRITPGDVD